LEVLRFLEGMRTPVGDWFFSTITYLGDELVFMLVGLLFYWCIDKKKGYYLLTVGFLGTVINQFLKLWFRVPRSWVRDADFTIVESARADATGYSFPSGHSQASVGIFGGVARFTKKKYIRILCVAVCVLVPFSRLYLGVHTPMDVIVSVVIATGLVFLVYPLVYKAMENPKYMRGFMLILAGIAAFYIMFVELYPFPTDIDMHNYTSGRENAYKMLGCIIGMWFAYELDSRFIQFSTKGNTLSQIIKLVGGLLLVLVIKYGMKAPLYSLIPTETLADGIRYFMLTAFAGGIWPMFFANITGAFEKKL